MLPALYTCYVNSFVSGHRYFSYADCYFDCHFGSAHQVDSHLGQPRHTAESAQGQAWSGFYADCHYSPWFCSCLWVWQSEV